MKSSLIFKDGVVYVPVESLIFEENIEKFKYTEADNYFITYESSKSMLFLKNRILDNFKYNLILFNFNAIDRRIFNTISNIEIETNDCLDDNSEKRTIFTRLKISEERKLFYKVFYKSEDFCFEMNFNNKMKIGEFNVLLRSKNEFYDINNTLISLAEIFINSLSSRQFVNYIKKGNIKFIKLKYDKL